MANKRVKISISDDDRSWLEGYCQVHQISLAEAIRQGICLLKERQKQMTYQYLVESTCGIWKKGDGLGYQEKIRSEWE